MKIKAVKITINALLTGTFVSGSIISTQAMTNPAQGFDDLGTGAALRTNLLGSPVSGFKSTEAKCGEGKCGEEAKDTKAGKEESKAAEHKCGEGKCGTENEQMKEMPSNQTPEKMEKQTRENIGSKPKNEIKKPK